MPKNAKMTFFAALFIVFSVNPGFSEPATSVTLDDLPREMMSRFDRPRAALERDLLISSIQDSGVIPNNYLFPLIEWQKPNKSYDAFLIEIKSKNQELDILLKRNRWQPEDKEFQPFLKDKQMVITLYGLCQGKTEKSLPVRLIVSDRSLNNRIAFRQVQPLFDPRLSNAIKIFSFDRKELTTLVEFEGTCVGCHGYSSRSAFFNLKNVGGRRLVTSTQEGQVFQPNIVNIGEFSFLTISRDGKYAAFAANAIGKLKVYQTPVEPFQLPYESGDIYYYDAEKNSVSPLKGASDPSFIEDMPFFSPDGKTLLFSRYQYGVKDGVPGIPSIDLYRVPFNEGAGGEPVPVKNASSNNLYQYFPRFAGNGKWISFCRGDGRQGIYARRSSDIFLLSTQDNTVTKLNLNKENAMDSWHDWSPDSHWLIFSSNREMNNLTALYLAFVDDSGKDYPPVKLVGYDRLKVNTPQFVPEDLNLEEAKNVKEYINRVFPGRKRR